MTSSLRRNPDQIADLISETVDQIRHHPDLAPIGLQSLANLADEIRGRRDPRFGG